MRTIVNWNNLPTKAAKFLDMLETMLGKLHLDIPPAALFVTPADLLNRSKNLIRYDTVCVSQK
jgi:hypothetical protein